MAMHRNGERFQEVFTADLGEGRRNYVASGWWNSGDKSVQMRTTHREGDDYSKPFQEYQMGFKYWKEEYYVNTNMYNTVIY